MHLLLLVSLQSLTSRSANFPAAADVLALAMMLLIAFAVAGVELDVAVHENQQIRDKITALCTVLWCNM
jgi:hypothetical protein